MTFSLQQQAIINDLPGFLFLFWICNLKSLDDLGIRHSTIQEKKKVFFPDPEFDKQTRILVVHLCNMKEKKKKEKSLNMFHGEVWKLSTTALWTVTKSTMFEL